ncbi:MAG: DUF1778 domain-containing protein [Abyssibacter sp.]|nr:DUF1778 domain-containing protein [Abyssibacter sp.]
MNLAPDTTRAPRDDRLETRCTRDEKQLVARAAAVAGMPLSRFVINHLVADARRVLHEAETMTAGARDRAAMIEALRNPAPANDALRRAMRSHTQHVTARD